MRFVDIFRCCFTGTMTSSATDGVVNQAAMDYDCLIKFLALGEP